MEWTVDWGYTYPLRKRTGHSLGSVARLIFLLVCALFFACDSSAEKTTASAQFPIEQHTPQGDETCRPMLLKIPDNNVSLKTGAWQYVFNIIVAGCSGRLDELSPGQRQLIVKLATSEVEKRGIRIIADVDNLKFREHLRDESNKLLGSDVISDIYLNLLWTAEAM
jgi:hypothetical protein